MQTATPLRAWRGELTKAEALERARKHIEIDRLLMHGATGNVLVGEEGCSVACTVGTYDRGLYPTVLGMPAWVGALQDAIYENLPRDERELDVRWTLDVLGAVPEDVDCERALAPILSRILEEVALRAVPKDSEVAGVVRRVIGALCMEPGEARDRELDDARSAAESAARWTTDADDARSAAADAARWAAAADAAAAAYAADAAAADAARWAADADDEAAAAYEQIRAIMLEELARLEPEAVA